MQSGQTVAYKNKVLPYLLLAPQIIITLVFFIWPAAEALFQSVMVENTFGTASKFVWFENFIYILEDSNYIYSIQITAIFAVATTLTSMGFSLLLAVTGRSSNQGSYFLQNISNLALCRSSCYSWYSVVLYVQPQCRDTCLLSSEYGIRMEPSTQWK